jgi:hypothetical protein
MLAVGPERPMTPDPGRAATALVSGGSAHLAAEHIHLHQEERFEVLSEHAMLKCRGEGSVSGPGEIVTVAPGSPHAWAPAGDEGARVRIVFTPGASIEEFFDEFLRYGRDGRVNAKGMPSLVVAARLGLAHDLYLAGPPVALQGVAFRILTGAAPSTTAPAATPNDENIIIIDDLSQPV